MTPPRERNFSLKRIELRAGAGFVSRRLAHGGSLGPPPPPWDFNAEQRRLESNLPKTA